MHHKSYVASVWTFLAVITMLLGCSGEAPSQPTTAGDPEAKVTQTIVVLDPNGPPRVAVHEVTVKEVEAQKVARAHWLDQLASDPSASLGTSTAAIGQDTSCASSSMWIFSAANDGGSEICFLGTGTAYLSDYCFVYLGGSCEWTWSGNVRSFWAGSSGGDFGGGTGGPYNFPAYQHATSVGTSVSTATNLYLGPA
jgi:hypothetical protein